MNYQINSATVQYSQNTTQNTAQGDFEYRLDCKKPVERFAFLQAKRFDEELKKSRVVTYRGLKKASGRAIRKLQQIKA